MVDFRFSLHWKSVNFHINLHSPPKPRSAYSRKRFVGTASGGRLWVWYFPRVSSIFRWFLEFLANYCLAIGNRIIIHYCAFCGKSNLLNWNAGQKRQYSVAVLETCQKHLSPCVQYRSHEVAHWVGGESFGPNFAHIWVTNWSGFRETERKIRWWNTLHSYLFMLWQMMWRVETSDTFLPSSSLMELLGRRQAALKWVGSLGIVHNGDQEERNLIIIIIIHICVNCSH